MSGENVFEGAIDGIGSGYERLSNRKHEAVRWVFRRITRVREVMDDVLSDSTEVWATVKRG
jgi:hypothetical protein